MNSSNENRKRNNSVPKWGNIYMKIFIWNHNFEKKFFVSKIAYNQMTTVAAYMGNLIVLTLIFSLRTYLMIFLVDFWAVGNRNCVSNAFSKNCYRAKVNLGINIKDTVITLKDATCFSWGKLFSSQIISVICFEEPITYFLSRK